MKLRFTFTLNKIIHYWSYLLGSIILIVTLLPLGNSALAATPMVTLLPLFQDGFESGTLSAWEIVNGLQVLSTEVHTGGWAARGTSSNAATFARKTLSSSQTDLYYRTFIKVISQSNNTVYLLRFRTAGGSGTSIVGVYLNGSGVLAYRNDVAGTTKTSTGVVAPGAWHEVQAHVQVNGASSLVELWLDGTLVVTRTESLGTAAIGVIQLGENSTGTRSYDIAFDDLIVDTSYIPSSAVIATPTPLPLPTNTPTALPTDTPAVLPTSTPTPLPTTTPTPALTEVALGPVADAHVDFASPGINFGTTTSLVVDSSPNTESFLRFDVSGGTGAIVGAKLRLFVRDATDVGPSVYSTSNNWTETGITWSTKPPRTGSPIVGTGTLALNTWVEYDVTSLVTGNGTYSFNLVPASADAAAFNSRESGATTQRPQLVVTYD
ncbi:MAG: DNRLRE domain-containing protein, partial [Chloroflexota bacterium]|nr:DNRLRE domain-containing protein [Chloroflexota bacterium]